MIDTVECPVCGGKKFDQLIDFGAIPASGCFLATPDQSCVKVPHSFEFCPDCALIRRVPHTEIVPDYTRVDRTTAGQTPAYTGEIIQMLASERASRAGLMVDVGGNDGAFLNLIAQAGYTNRLNIEPSVALAETCRGCGHLIENVHFCHDETVRIRERYGRADAVFCRHVLEHIPDPLDALTAARLILKEDGFLFIEVPDARGIIHGLLGHELWHEHLFHFTLQNLTALLNRTGYTVYRSAIKSHRGGTNILVWARPDSPREISTLKNAVESDVEALKTFHDRWSALRRRILAETERWPKPIGCIGASHPQSNYLLFSGVADYVDFLVDDDPLKVGRYAPLPHPVPVLSTEQLLSNPAPGTIVRTAFGCDSWMDRICRTLGPRGTHIAEPYLAPPTWRAEHE